MIIKDYGFATFLVYNNYEHSTSGTKELSFNISESKKEDLLKQYRKSTFYEYDLIGRMLKKELKKD